MSEYGDLDIKTATTADLIRSYRIISAIAPYEKNPVIRQALEFRMADIEAEIAIHNDRILRGAS